VAQHTMQKSLDNLNVLFPTTEKQFTDKENLMQGTFFSV
jgi:hypothetical protein